MNIPFALGWLILGMANTVWQVFAGLILIGLAVGEFDMFKNAFFLTDILNDSL